MPNPNPVRPARTTPEPSPRLPKYVSFHASSGLYRLRRPGQKTVYAPTVDELVPPETLVRFEPGMTTGEYLDLWLRDLNLRPNSIAGHRRNVENYLRPTFGRVRLAALDRDAIRDGLRGLRGVRGGDLSPRTIALAHATLRAALSAAVDARRLERNEAVRLNLFPRGATGRQKLPGVELAIPDEAAVRAMLVEARGDRWYPLLSLSVNTGLRQSEALGLTWEDVDLDRRLVHVRRSMVRYSRTLDDPKNATSRRVVPFPPEVGRALRAHRLAQAEERLAAGSSWGKGAPEGLVFTNETGAPADARSIDRWYKRVVRRATRRSFRWHDLRHAYATTLLARGVPIHVVSKLLGHASLAITTEVYAHLDIGTAAAAAEVLDAAYAMPADEAAIV